VKDFAAWLTEISGRGFRIDGELGESRVTIRATDVPLKDVLALLTLPRGWDVRLDSGMIVIYARKD
jgi:hypothetical protein